MEAGITVAAPRLLRSPEELIGYVNEVGFLPLFQNELPGFSLMDHTDLSRWWTEPEADDPWAWRQVAAESGRVVYAKLFRKKAGFVSLEWFPYFVNARREGYDFDARWEDGRASVRARRLMEQFDAPDAALLSNVLKEQAGFGREGERNFEGAVTELQMQTYLVIREFRRRLNRQGIPYGWPIAVYAAPESIWGDAVTAAYGEAPAVSRQRILDRLRVLCPGASEAALRRWL